MTGKHQEAAVSFSKQELKLISTTQIPLSIKYEEVAEVQTWCYCFRGIKRKKNERTQTFSSRKDETWFRSELLFQCTPWLSLRILQIYLSIIPYYQSHAISTKIGELCCQLPQTQHSKPNKKERPTSPFYSFSSWTPYLSRIYTNHATWSYNL